MTLHRTNHAARWFFMLILMQWPVLSQEHSLIEGLGFYAAHNYQEAITVFQGIIAKAPRNGEAWVWLGRSYANVDRREEAITAFKRAIDLAPGYAETYVLLGLEYDALGRTEEEIEVLKQALEVNRMYVDAYDYLARAQNRLGHYDEAIRR